MNLTREDGGWGNPDTRGTAQATIFVALFRELLSRIYLYCIRRSNRLLTNDFIPIMIRRTVQCEREASKPLLKNSYSTPLLVVAT